MTVVTASPYPSGRRSAWALVDQAIVSGTSFATTILVGRMAGEAELGIYALGVTIVLLAATAQDSLVSVPYTFFRGRVHPERAAEYRGSVLAHWALISGAVALGLAAFAVTLGWGFAPRWIVTVAWVLAALLPSILLRDFARRFAFAHLEVGTALAIDVAVAALQLGAVLALGLAGRLSGVVALGALGTATGLAALVWLALGRAAFRVHAKEIGPTFGLHWRFARWDLSAQVVGIVQAYLVYWLLALLRGAGETGVFAACMTIVTVSNPFILGINNVFMPRVAEAAARGPAEVRRVVRGTTLPLGVAMAVITAALILFGGTIVRLVYGSAFAGQGLIVAVLAVTAAAGAMQITVANGLRALERPDIYLGAGVAALLVTLAAGWPLVRAFGIEGAAWALLAGGLVETVVQWARFGRLVGASALR